ncbi:hypothetical protein CDAR_45741 [Caerostris darwini]|uniref:Uncharacterized protein n=1 Tax=Caerostris darwini TaxID=1538125 RepID=A0AAV4W459_9ARAC|nr:hypothetical protein CDAR_45741 [Caerostris darwini]
MRTKCQFPEDVPHGKIGPDGIKALLFPPYNKVKSPPTLKLISMQSYSTDNDMQSIRNGFVTFPGPIFQERGPFLLDGRVLDPVAAINPDRAMLQFIGQIRRQGLPWYVGGEVHAAAETLLEEHTGITLINTRTTKANAVAPETLTFRVESKQVINLSATGLFCWATRYYKQCRREKWMWLSAEIWTLGTVERRALPIKTQIYQQGIIIKCSFLICLPLRNVLAETASSRREKQNFSAGVLEGE